MDCYRVHGRNHFRPLSKPLSRGYENWVTLTGRTLRLSIDGRFRDFAMKNRLPAMYGNPVWMTDGGLISYGHDRRHQWRRAAHFVDKILKGAKPADLPVEQPSKFELIINLNTAKQIGVIIPQSVLFRADKVIR